MCGRYTLTTNDRQRLGERFGAIMPDEGLERFNVAPTESVAAVVDRQDRRARGARAALGSRARLREVAQGRAADVQRALGDRRREAPVQGPARQAARPLPDRSPTASTSGCARRTRRAPRVPFRFTVDGGEPFAFAGLWGWSKPEGEWLASATHADLTQPNAVVARLHDRMPVILPGPDAEAAWLSPDLAAGGRARAVPAAGPRPDDRRPPRTRASTSRASTTRARTCSRLHDRLRTLRSEAAPALFS